MTALSPGKLMNCASTALHYLADQIRRDMNRTLKGNESGLAAYYKMSNGSGTTVTDDSINSHDGTMNDGWSIVVLPDGDTAEWITSGAFAGPRNALDFDGSNDYVSVPADITLPANLTLEAWVYPRYNNWPKLDRWRSRRRAIDNGWHHGPVPHP